MTSSWFFLSTLNYDTRSATHQIAQGIGWAPEPVWTDEENPYSIPGSSSLWRVSMPTKLSRPTLYNVIILLSMKRRKWQKISVAQFKVVRRHLTEVNYEAISLGNGCPLRICTVQATLRYVLSIATTIVCWYKSNTRRNVYNAYLAKFSPAITVR